MNRVWIGAAVGLAVAVGVLLNVQQVVSADSPIVIRNDGVCGLPGADENGDFTFGGLGEATVTENDNKVMLKCKGEGIRNDSGRAQKFEGFLCGIFTAAGQVVETDDSHAVVSASGAAMMTCTYKK